MLSAPVGKFIVVYYNSIFADVNRLLIGLHWGLAFDILELL